MCSLNISSQSRKKSLSLCATSKSRTNKAQDRLAVPLALFLACFLGFPANAQIERQTLPPLPGEAQPAQPPPPPQPGGRGSPDAYPPPGGQDTYQPQPPVRLDPSTAPARPDAYAAPPQPQPQQAPYADPFAMPPGQAAPSHAAPDPYATTPQPQVPSAAPAPVYGAPPGGGLPPGLWRATTPQELQQLIGSVPLPYPSPILADTMAQALAAPDDDATARVRLDTLVRAGRLGELISLADRLGQGETFRARLDEIAAQGGPASLYRQAHDTATPPLKRLEAAEKAASLNVIDGETLAKVYRETAGAVEQEQTGPALRARLFAALESSPPGQFRADSIDALLASGPEIGIEFALGTALARASGELAQAQVPGFAENGLRVAALAGDNARAWNWVDAGGDSLSSWQLLLAAAEPLGPRAERAFQAGADMAMRGGLPAALLHRLVTVLDALDYNVPIPLWDAASQTPQPNDGFLPETGMLTQLKEAAEANQAGKTILLAAASLGPQGPGAAHLIALGDSVRALKRVGLDAQARRLGFEALYAHWPKRPAAQH
jgi:hypothetical protein